MTTCSIRVRGAFAGFKVGDRLRLTREATGFAAVGTELEIVEMLGPNNDNSCQVPDDGIRVKIMGEESAQTADFVWTCGASYFK